MSGERVLEARGLYVRYGGRGVLEGVNLTLERGVFYALLGRNGAGKSSLVRCALGQQKPERGAVALFGKDVWKERMRLMERVGVLPEDPDAPPGMTPAELAAFCQALYPRWDDETTRARLARARVPLDVPFARLSKGQRGAVGLALALGHGPELLVLDDPTLGLDAVAKHELYDELIGDLADRGATVLLTTHDLGGVEALADHVGILDGARLLVDEPLDTLKGRFRRIQIASPEVALDFRPFASLRETRREWGVDAVVADFDEEKLQAFRTGHVGRDIEVLPLSLEEIFLALLGTEEGQA